MAKVIGRCVGDFFFLAWKDSKGKRAGKGGFNRKVQKGEQGAETIRPRRTPQAG